jgi:AraC-like DNA-binding protein
MARGPIQFRIVTEFPPALAEAPAALATLAITQASASLYACTPAWQIARRRQRHDLLLLAVAGRGRVAIDGRWFSLAPRRLLYAARGSWLQAEGDPAAPLRLILLAHRAETAGGVPFAISAGLPSAIQLRDEDGIEQTLLAACREEVQRSPGWQAALHALVALALVTATRRAGPRCQPPPVQAAGALARIRPAVAVMSQDLAQPLRIAELALACDLGPVQFRRLFRAALGRSPVAYLQHLRLAEAQRLIAGGALVREAAEAVGYRSSACLDRVFRRLAGTTPGRWRTKVAAT